MSRGPAAVRAWPETALRAGLALAAAAGLGGMLLLQRLPQTAGFILPRRAGFFLFSPLIAVAGDPRLRAAAAWLFLALVAVPALAAFWLLARGVPWRQASRGPAEAALRLVAAGACAYACGRLAQAFLLQALDIIENAWFFPESLSLAEPACVLAVSWAAGYWLLETLSRSLAWVYRTPTPSWPAGRSAARLLAAGFLAWTGTRGLAEARYAASAASLADAVGLPPEPLRRRVVAVLDAVSGRPEVRFHDLELGLPGESECAPESLAALESYLAGPRTVYTLPVLRRLYGARLLVMDAAGLRRALLRGHELGDGLARILLLDNLAHAAPAAEAAGALAALADTARYRVGPQAAAQLALGYARLGARAETLAWLTRAAEALGGPSPGLLDPPLAGPLKPGTIRGRVRGLARADVALYARREGEGASAHALGPGQLAAATVLDRRGDFSFTGLPAGTYFLALSFEPKPGRRPRLRGHKGDIVLSPRRPKIELPPLDISF